MDIEIQQDLHTETYDQKYKTYIATVDKWSIREHIVTYHVYPMWEHSLVFFYRKGAAIPYQNAIDDIAKIASTIRIAPK